MSASAADKLMRQRTNMTLLTFYRNAFGSAHHDSNHSFYRSGLEERGKESDGGRWVQKGQIGDISHNLKQQYKIQRQIEHKYVFKGRQAQIVQFSKRKRRVIVRLFEPYKLPTMKHILLEKWIHW